MGGLVVEWVGWCVGGGFVSGWGCVIACGVGISFDFVKIFRRNFAETKQVSGKMKFRRNFAKFSRSFVSERNEKTLFRGNDSCS